MNIIIIIGIIFIHVPARAADGDVITVTSRPWAGMPYVNSCVCLRGRGMKPGITRDAAPMLVIVTMCKLLYTAVRCIGPHSSWLYADSLIATLTHLWPNSESWPNANATANHDDTDTLNNKIMTGFDRLIPSCDSRWQSVPLVDSLNYI